MVLCIYVAIIHIGNSTNVAVAIIVDKLKLPTIPHRQPYRLRQLNKRGFAYVIK